MSAYLRILKQAPWWQKFSNRVTLGGASTDIRYRKPKAEEAALSKESCLPDNSDVGASFLQESKVKLCERPLAYADSNADSDDEF